MSALTDRLRTMFKRDGSLSRSQRTDMQTFLTNFDTTEALAGANEEIDTEAITATVGGGTTGLISAATDMAIVTCDTATKQISLPAAVVGKKLRIYVGANGCELISAVAAHKINNVVVGATNEAAIPATTYLELDYVAANEWIMRAYTELGAVVTAIVPDTL